MYLHLVLLFWNHVFTCASVIFNALAKADLKREFSNNYLTCFLQKELFFYQKNIENPSLHCGKRIYSGECDKRAIPPPKKKWGGGVEKF